MLQDWVCNLLEEVKAFHVSGTNCAFLLSDVIDYTFDRRDLVTLALCGATGGWYLLKKVIKDLVLLKCKHVSKNKCFHVFITTSVTDHLLPTVTQMSPWGDNTDEMYSVSVYVLHHNCNEFIF